jgi:hypothetical protein
MAPKQYVEKPAKILAEQYHAADQPPIAGVCTLVHDVVPDGAPHAHVAGFGPRVLQDTDMLVWSHYDPDVLVDVQALAEFEDRYGNVPGIVEER